MTPTHHAARPTIRLDDRDDPADDPAEDAAVDAAVGRQLDLRLRRLNGVTGLLTVRQDLRGVNVWVDFVDDAVRWSA